MFEQQGAHHNPDMVAFINDALRVRSVMETTHGLGVLEFRAGLFNGTDEPPFVVLGPVTEFNARIFHGITKRLPRSWIHVLAHDDICSIAEEAS